MTLEVVRFYVPGEPIPQGSSRAFVHNGRATITSANRRLRPWRTSVAWEARAALGDRDPFDGPVFVSLTFTFRRPAGHFGARGELRASAPAQHVKRPDLDKLVRAMLDAITEAGVIGDDAQVCQLVARKCYGPAAGVDVVLAEVDE